MTYKYFTLDEFACSETSENEIDPHFVLYMDVLRGRCGYPLVITSGYRSPAHSIEAAKEKLGRHTRGRTCDVACTDSVKRYKIIKHAIEMGFTEISVGKDFVHLGMDGNLGLSWHYYG